MEQVFIELAKMSPVVGVLAFFVWYFIKELRMKNDEIKELNTLLRNQHEKTLATITSFTDAVRKLTELIEKKL